MKTKKNVSDAVIAANQQNAAKSTGPRTKEGKLMSRTNALKHGLSATTVSPDDEDAEHERELARWRVDFEPQGVWEESLVCKIAYFQRKETRFEALENQELSKLEAQMGNVLGVFNDSMGLPIEWVDLPVDCGLNCDKITVRASSLKANTSSDGSRGPGYYQGQPAPGWKAFSDSHGNTGRRLEVEAVLVSALDKIRRYRDANRRDLYKAVEALHAAQKERRKRETEESCEVGDKRSS